MAVVLQPEMLVHFVLLVVKALPQYVACATHRMVQQFVFELKELIGATSFAAPEPQFNHTAAVQINNENGHIYTASQWILGASMSSAIILHWYSHGT
eukprot:11937917-Karenia_brevis.AAC.1